MDTTKLGEILLEAGKVTADQLRQAQQRHERTGEPLGAVLAELASVTEGDLLAMLGEHMRAPVVSLEWAQPEREALELLPRELAERYGVFPVRIDGDVLEVAVTDPTNVPVLDEIRHRVGMRVRPALALASDIEAAIQRAYANGEEAQEQERADDTPAPSGLSVRQSVLADLVERAPVIRILDSIMESAVRERASDIHVERQEEGLYIRFRVDGVMHDYLTPDPALHAPLVSRIKILAGMNISERRLPQDGRFTFETQGEQYDIRVSTVPSTMGEKAVLRLLPKSHEILQLDQLGLDQQRRLLFEDLIQRAFGIIIVAGPTGSGKTTTLYAALGKIDAVERNVITIEDPVEYEFSRVTQIQVHPKIGLTFASGLRSILRQDPDIVLVGEIRDEETLRMAVQASLTGHLVFSTLHCNDTSSAAARLMDMGLEPYLLTSSVLGFLSQRLVRRVCPHCKEPFDPPEDLMRRLGVEDARGIFYKGPGCEKCRHTGYYGRIGVFEVLPVTEAVRQAILREAPASDIRRIAVSEGMQTMRDDGLAKAKAGITALEEVLRAVYIEDE